MRACACVYECVCVGEKSDGRLDDRMHACTDVPTSQRRVEYYVIHAARGYPCAAESFGTSATGKSRKLALSWIVSLSPMKVRAYVYVSVCMCVCDKSDRRPDRIVMSDVSMGQHRIDCCVVHAARACACAAGEFGASATGQGRK